MEPDDITSWCSTHRNSLSLKKGVSTPPVSSLLFHRRPGWRGDLRDPLLEKVRKENRRLQR